MKWSRATIPENVLEMKNMKRGVHQNKLSETIARAVLWEGKAITMGTDNSVQDPFATYSFVISISRTDVKTNVKGSGFLPRPNCSVFGSVFETFQSGGAPCWAYMDTGTSSPIPY
jgi:hypothetical protein